jgi:hypothetical protein
MSIEAHRCNVKGCNGFVVFENADFDFKNPLSEEKLGNCYAFDVPECTTCGKEFFVIPAYIVIDAFDDGDFEQLESACITEWEKQRKSNHVR